MATYAELFDISAKPEMVNRVAVACMVKANVIAQDGAATAEQKAWAVRVVQNPMTEAKKAYLLMLAQNEAVPVATILAATDTAIQNAVDSVVALLASAST